MKRLFYLLFGLVLLPALLYAQGTLSLKDINDNLTNNYYNKTASDARYATTTYGYSSAEVDILLAPKTDKTYVNATDEAIISDNDSQDVTIEANRVGVASLEVGLQTHQNNLSNPHQVTATQTAYTDTYSMAATTVQSAIDTLEAWLGGFVTDSFVYGFVDPVTATLSYDASTQTFTITGSHEIYINGKRVTKGTASKTHPATTGIHYFYYDSDGVLQTSTDLWGGNFFTVAQIAYVYYNASKVSTPAGLMFDEEHSHIMDTAVHYYLHTTRGSTSSDLFPLGSYSTAPAVPTNAGNQFSTTGGTLVDEDHRETIADVPDGGYYPIFWREGAAGDWTWTSGTYPVLVGTNYPKYNQLTGGSWTTTEVTAGQYINMYTAVTNAADSTYSVVLIMGQSVYATLALAQAANPINTMSWGDLPFNEIIVTNKITFRTSNGYGTIGKCRIESVESLAGITIRLGTAVSASSHSSLSGRSDPGQHPASAISYVDTYDLGVTDVQAALDTIELWLSAIDVTDDSQDVAINAHLIDTIGAHAATAISATWTNVQVSLDSIEAAIQGIVVGSGFALESWVNSTLETNFYNKTQTDDTIAAAIAAIPAPSVNQTVTVTAGEALTAGQVVSLINESGTMKAYNNPLTVSTSPNGAESVFNAATTTYCSAVALDSTRFLVAYSDSDTYPKAIVGTVTGSTISWGSESAAFENVAATYLSACKIATDKILVCYKDGTNNLGRMVVLSISTATITVGTPTDFYGSIPTYISLAQLDTDKALICYDGASEGKTSVITVSGTTPSYILAERKVFNAAATAYISVSALSSTSAIVAYSDGGNSNFGTAQILSISGTTITPGTEYVFANSSCTYISTGSFSPTKVLIAFRNSGSSDKGNAIVAIISATNISYGTLAEFQAVAYGTSTTILDINHALISFVAAGASQGKSIVVIENNSNLTFNDAYIFNGGATAYQYLSNCYLGNQKSAIVFQDTDNSSYGTSVVNQWATSNYASVAGISQGAYSSGSDAVVLISGVSDDQSGLIVGSPYFLQSDFTIGTTPVSLAKYYNSSTATGEIKVGTAKSATELIIGIDYK